MCIPLIWARGIEPMETAMKKMILASVLALASLGLASTADAANWWAHHPRRAEVNERLNTQRFRINQEYRHGEISRAQARDLHAEDRGIRAQERYYASRDGGHITRGEQARLNHEENGMSRQIGR
jgi:hypothetical protein